MTTGGLIFGLFLAAIATIFNRTAPLWLRWIVWIAWLIAAIWFAIWLWINVGPPPLG